MSAPLLGRVRAVAGAAKCLRDVAQRVGHHVLAAADLPQQVVPLLLERCQQLVRPDVPLFEPDDGVGHLLGMT